MKHKNPDAARAVIIFAKAPEKGKVKTRLARDMDEDFVVFLYGNLVEKTLETVRQTPFVPIVCFSPAEKEQIMKNWLGRHVSYLVQRGEDLGQRISVAFRASFEKGFSQVLVIGSDIPGIEPNHLEEAFSLLQENDAVIGPAYDGGYWLIGFNRNGFSPHVFADIPWSTDHVLGDTMEKCAGLGLSAALAAKLRDIDTVQDLNLLWRDIQR
ncbi:MAG: TIGR04282 family arsenosugar biosynthesis glycosyltransferase [Desulfarculaceae bacterium]|nr:TIGR04282 family arsenosugar biosynthesis glycosyltransferase [Desulfarculaceae bacterium]